MEHLWMNGMVGSDGELTPLGKFTADMEPSDPENAALLWYANQFNVLREASCHICNPDKRKLIGKPKGQGSLSTPGWRFPHHGQHMECG